MQVYIRLRSGSQDEAYTWQRASFVRRMDAINPSTVLVQLQNGTLVEVNETHDVLIANEQSIEQLASIDNLDALCHLHEASLVEYLQQRYAVDHVYCQSGGVLIAMNPFKELRGLYDITAFRERIAHERDRPHVFTIAERAFRALNNQFSTQNQTILVSGESGAGKTESTKFIMNYLVHVSTNSTNGTHQRASHDAIEAHVLNATPILESFGNARTLRNDNSSRFGKFIRMYFGNYNHMVGMAVETYLLEKVRVVHQAQGERNFHIFYELLAGLEDPSLRSVLKLDNKSPNDFRYLNDFGRKDGVEDRVQFQRVLEAMGHMNMDRAMQESIWKVLSGILYLGNLVFSDGDKSESTAACQVTSMDALERVARLFAVNADALVVAMTSRKITVGGECFQVQLTQAQCQDSRDAMARALYGSLFQYLVHSVNQTAKTKEKMDDDQSRAFIAVLDIFGFEEFEQNQFEQFCINYANEKLQLQFLRDVLANEQRVHVDEGIPWQSIDVGDQTVSQCLEMIETRPTGIFALLDEECLMPKGNDASFARKLYAQWQKHAHFSATRKDQVDQVFQIQHYAGQVRYQATGFCEKNRDQQNAECLQLLRSSTEDDGMKQLLTAFAHVEEDDGMTNKREDVMMRRRPSMINAIGIGSQFKQQLASLLEIVDQTETHYIRCIKPNDANARNRFEVHKVANQLRYGGVFKAVEITRQCFPVRMLHEQFVHRYRSLVTAKTALSATEWAAALEIDASSYAWGKTRVFMKQAAFDALEKKRTDRMDACAIRMQSKWKQWRQRQWFLQVIRHTRTLQRWWKAVYKERMAKRRREAAAMTIQRSMNRWRRCRQQRHQEAAIILQRWLRRRSRRIIVARSTVHDKPLVPQPSHVDVKDLDPSEEEEDASRTTYSISTSCFSDASEEEQHKMPPPSDHTALQLAMKELEQLRRRAEAAEAALARLASTPSPQTTPATVTVLPQAPPIKTSLLHAAITNANVDQVFALLMQLCVDRPAAVNAMESFETGCAPLHLAVQRGHIEILGLFFHPDVLPHVDLNVRDRDGNTPLHYAMKYTQANDAADHATELLLAFGADANAVNYLHQTPLHLCAMVRARSRPLEACSTVHLMKKLLDVGRANPRQMDFLKRTPLHYCVERELEQEAIVLMQYGADLNIADAHGARLITHRMAPRLLRFITVEPTRIPKETTAACMICHERFSSNVLLAFMQRKQRCQRCGRICCGDCCPSDGPFCFDCQHC